MTDRLHSSLAGATQKSEEEEFSAMRRTELMEQRATAGTNQSQPTTELEKWAAVVGDVRNIEEFLEWASERGWFLEHRDGSHLNIHALLAEHFCIDLAQLEKERRALIDDMRQGR